jgi:hypothetical protein
MMMMHELDVTYTDTFSPDPSRFLLTLGGCRSSGNTAGTQREHSGNTAGKQRENSGKTAGEHSGKTAGKQRENSGKTAEMGRQVAVLVAGTIPPWAGPIRHFGRSEKAVRMLD